MNTSSNLPNLGFSAQDGSLRNITKKMQRNDTCPINFDKKFKKCCGKEGINFCRKLLSKEMEENFDKVAIENNLSTIIDAEGNKRYVPQEVADKVAEQIEKT